MQLGEQPLAAVSIFPFPLCLFSGLCSFGVSLWRAAVCVGEQGAEGKCKRTFLQKRGFCCKESVVEFPKRSGLHSLSSRIHLQKLLESVGYSRGLHWLESYTGPSLLSCSPYQPSAHPSGCNGIQPWGCSKAQLQYKHRERKREYSSCLWLFWWVDVSHW